MALTDIQKLRIEIGDTSPEFPILDDSSYQYFLDKHSNNIPRAAIDAARAILFQLSTMNSETVSIFSVKNTSAEAYRQALLLYIKDQNLNPLYQTLKGYFGGISITDIQANVANIDNNIVVNPGKTEQLYQVDDFNLGWRF